MCILDFWILFSSSLFDGNPTELCTVGQYFGSTLKMVVWYFEEGCVVLWRGRCGTLKRVVWYFEEGWYVNILVSLKCILYKYVILLFVLCLLFPSVNTSFPLIQFNSRFIFWKFVMMRSMSAPKMDVTSVVFTWKGLDGLKMKNH